MELLEARNAKLEKDMDEANATKLVLAQIIQDQKNQEDAQEKRRMGRTTGVGLLLLFLFVSAASLPGTS